MIMAFPEFAMASEAFRRRDAETLELPPLRRH